MIVGVVTTPPAMTTLPLPSVSRPPPASPARLLLMVLLLTVSVQGVLAGAFSIDTPPPSALAVLLVTTMLFRVRLALPWSRMPPPLPGAASPRRRRPPFVMVKP